MKVSRRNFLATAGAAGVAPLLLGTTNKSGSRAPILGEGEYRYEALHDWGGLPSHIRYGNTHGVCEDSQGHIYVHHTVHATSESPETIVVFDREGKFVRSWGGEFEGGAHGLSIHKEGREEFLYPCDFQHGMVTKRTLKGEEAFTLGYPAESPAYQGKNGMAPSYRPTNVAIAPMATSTLATFTVPATSTNTTKKRNSFVLLGAWGRPASSIVPTAFR